MACQKLKYFSASQKFQLKISDKKGEFRSQADLAWWNREVSSKRFIVPWKDSAVKPAIYHCISRIVDRRFVFEDREGERFPRFMSSR